MAKIRLQLNNTPLEYEGTPQEITEFLRTLGAIPQLNELEETQNFPKFKGKEVQAFIESQPNMKHSLLDIIRHFYGNNFDLKENREVYYRVFGLTDRARKRIAEKLKGEFITETETDTSGATNKPFKVYYFKK